MKDVRQLTRIFRALSVDTRIRMLLLLKERPLCVGALAQRLGVTSAAVSQHLRVLRDADLVIPDKRGYYVHYLVNESTLEEWRRLANELLSTGGD
jgi:DNA-binding transcriptional ArsR family regulator